ncbi:beta-L-arabinofuranosidase domain-containing protein [Gracilibacillus sp. YIM 98692]|uniref:glycoside hydrolase family 127 protein n=1 Tax=Gracilibacillus sp. YIM 98692 TaxID=2663532 RepID=UPI001F09006F|nr:beta-L-arabinofuranosidase domain-containing protein [Gracilibacillus sp. YIM 98692]
MKMRPINLKNVKLDDAFWNPWQKLVKEAIIPYQWDALNDRIPGAEPSRTIQNFEIAAGKSSGTHYGMVFQDSDLYKWMETVAYSLANQRDEKWEKIFDDVVALIEEAQENDGYLNTYFSVNHPDQKWTNLKNDHELYCAGHLIEAAVAYYEATGKKRIIDVVSRLVDHIQTVLGDKQGKKRGYPGHPEIELALMKLYKVTGESKYMNLCQFFIEERGKRNPVHYYDLELEDRGGPKRSDDREYDYYQAHLPVREQKTVEGHAVRATYLYSGMIDLASELQDDELLEVCKTLWENTVNKRMYVTGGIGSSAHEERFTVDYDLPNDRAYTETCAAIALIMWAHRMVQVEGDSQYTDVLERALYNGALSGISLDGKGYFYVNPLEVWPHTANYRHDMKTVKPTRQQWFGCACCPPNIARLLASLGQYIYSANESEIYVHLFIGGETSFSIDSEEVQLTQTSNYPWDGEVQFTVSLKNATTFMFATRIPGWCKQAAITVNGEKVSYQVEKGYAKINRKWKDGDQIQLRLDMPVEVVRAHPEVRENAGKVALQRGPLVYCIEEVDNGRNLHAIQLPASQTFDVLFDETLLNGVSAIHGKAVKTDLSKIENSLYATDSYPEKDIKIKAIPYYAWCNRGENEMMVWIREK